MRDKALLVSDAIKFFSGSDGERGARSRMARALGVTVGAISQWGDVLPEGKAYKLESISNGKLKVDPSLYEKKVKQTQPKT